MKAIIDEHQANGGSAPKVLEEWIEPNLSQFVERLFMRGLDIRCMTHELTQRGQSELSLRVRQCLLSRILRVAKAVS